MRRRPLALLAICAMLALSPIATAADDSAEKPKAGAVRTFRFDSLDIEGHVKNPHLMYFLKRIRNKFRSFRLPEQKFIEKVIQTKDADFL